MFKQIFWTSNPRLDPEPGGLERLGKGYLSLRRWLGYIGVALPFLLYYYHTHDNYEEDLRTSISAYYYSGMRDVLVGSLAAIGVFLVTYRGNYLREEILAKFSGFGAIGVAFLPTERQCESVSQRDVWFKEYCGVPWSGHDPQVQPPPPLHPEPQPDYFLWFETDSYLASPEALATISNLHFLSAFIFLGGIAAMAFWPFALTSDTDVRTAWKKRWRNLLYRLCALVIVGCVVAIGIDIFGEKKGWWNSDSIHFVFWAEAVAVWAFALAWLVKGNFLGRFNPIFPQDKSLPREDPHQTASPEKPKSS